MTAKSKDYAIRGRITGQQTGGPLKGLRVTALDKDLFRDDRLGSCMTDDNGRFEIVFDRKAFGDLFEGKPDIYLQVANDKGEVIFTSIDKVRHGANFIEEFFLELDENDVSIINPDSMRKEFKKLITVNPGYFGNLGELQGDFKPVQQQEGNTTYEELLCIGNYPEDDILEAVFKVKLPYGFSGDLCREGSTEYVSFYIDYDDGNGYVSTGPAVELNAHDLSHAADMEIHYAVRQGFVPKRRENCQEPVIVKLRGILSWEQVPTGPGFTPVWGNILEALIQIHPKKKPILLPQIPSPAEFNPEIVPQFVIGGSDKFQMKQMIDLSIAAEEKTIHDLADNRFSFKKMIANNPNAFGSLSQSQDPDVLGKMLSTLSPNVAIALAEKLAAGLLLPEGAIDNKTEFEELKCVGLYPEHDLLEAVMEIKRDNGYGGDLCSLGTPEYVAFYIDWGGPAGFEYVGTTSVQVHDIQSDKPLMYAVQQRIPDIEKRLRDCKYENVVRVRAILSWNQDPTPYGAGFAPGWGNVLERWIQIRPKGGVSAKCKLDAISNIHPDDISQSPTSLGYARKIGSLTTFDRPFGGWVTVMGRVNVSGAAYYRVRYRKVGDATWIPVTQDRRARGILGLTLFRSPDANGWHSISLYNTDLGNYTLTPLVHWPTGGAQGEYEVVLELADSGKLPMAGQECGIFLLMDNQSPQLHRFRNTPIPTDGITVKDKNGNHRRCDMLEGLNEDIQVWGNFSDAHFRAYSMVIFGGNLPASGVSMSGLTGGSDRYDTGAGRVDGGGTLVRGDGTDGTRLMTFKMNDLTPRPNIQCAYGIRISLVDRTVRGSLRGYEFDPTSNSRAAYVTFDWKP